MKLIAQNTARAVAIAHQKDVDAAYKAAEDLASHTPQIRVRGKVTRTPPVTDHPTEYTFKPDKKGKWMGNVGPGTVPVKPHFKPKESAKVFPGLLKDPAYRRLTKNPRNVATANLMGLPVTGEAANRYINWIGGLVQSHVLDPNEVPGLVLPPEDRGEQLARIQAKVRLLKGYSKEEVDHMSLGQLAAAAQSPHGKYSNAYDWYGGRFLATIADNLPSDIAQAILGMPMGAAMIARSLVHDVQHPTQRSETVDTGTELVKGMGQFGSDIIHKPYETFTHHPATTALAAYGLVRPVFGKYGLGALRKATDRNVPIKMAENAGEFSIPGEGRNPDLPITPTDNPPSPANPRPGPTRGIDPSFGGPRTGTPYTRGASPLDRGRPPELSPAQRALDAAQASDTHAARTDAEIRTLLDEANAARDHLTQQLRELPPGHPTDETIARGAQIQGQIREIDNQIQHYHTDLQLPHPGHKDELTTAREELRQGIKDKLPQEKLNAMRAHIDKLEGILNPKKGHPLRDYHLITRDLGDYPEVNQKIIDAADEVAIESRKQLDPNREMPEGATPAFSVSQDRSLSEIAADIVDYQVGHNPDLKFRESEANGGPSTDLMHTLEGTLHDVALGIEGTMKGVSPSDPVNYNRVLVDAKNIYESMFSPEERAARFVRTPNELARHIIDYIKNIHELVLDEHGPKPPRYRNDLEERADARYQAAKDHAEFLHEQGYKPRPDHPDFRHNPDNTNPLPPNTLESDTPGVTRGNFNPVDPYGWPYDEPAPGRRTEIPPGREPKEPPTPEQVKRYIETGVHDPNAEISPAEVAFNVEKYKDNPRMLTQVLHVVETELAKKEDAIDGYSIAQDQINYERDIASGFRDYHQDTLENGVNGEPLTPGEKTEALKAYNVSAKNVHELTKNMLENADQMLEWMKEHDQLSKASDDIVFHLTTHEAKVLRPDSAGTVTRRKQLSDQITMLKMGLEQDLFGVDDRPRAVVTLDRYEKELAGLEEGLPFPRKGLTDAYGGLPHDTKANIRSKIPWYENRVSELEAELKDPQTRPGDVDSIQEQIRNAQDTINTYRRELEDAPVTDAGDSIEALRQTLAERREHPDAAAINAAQRRALADANKTEEPTRSVSEIEADLAKIEDEIRVGWPHGVRPEVSPPHDFMITRMEAERARLRDELAKAKRETGTEEAPPSDNLPATIEPGIDVGGRPPFHPFNRRNTAYEDPIFGDSGNGGLPPGGRGQGLAEDDSYGTGPTIYKANELVVNRGMYADNLIDRLFQWGSDKLLSLDPEVHPLHGYTRYRQNKFLAKEYGTSADRVRRAFYSKREELQDLVNAFADLNDTEITAIVQAHLQGVLPSTMKRTFVKLLKDEAQKMDRAAIPRDIRDALVRRTITQEQLRRLKKILTDHGGMDEHVKWLNEYMRKAKDQRFHDDQLLGDIFTDMWRPSHDLQQQVKLWTSISAKVGDDVTPIMQKAIDEARKQSMRIDDLLKTEGVLPGPILENRRYQRQRLVSSILGEEIPINEHAIYVPDRTVATTWNSYLMNRARSYDIKREFGGRLAKNKGEALISGRLNPSFDSYYTNLTSAVSKTDAIRLQQEILGKYAHKVPQNQLTYDGYKFVLFDARKGIPLHQIETRAILQDLNDSIDRGGIALSRLGNEQRVRGRNEYNFNHPFSPEDVAARDVGDLYLVPRPVYDAMVNRTAKAQFDSQFGRTQQRLVHTWRHIALALRPAYMIVNTGESAARTVVYGGLWSPVMWARIARLKSSGKFRNRAGEYVDDFGVTRGGGADMLSPPHIKRTSLSQNLMRRYHMGSQGFRIFGDERKVIRETYQRAKRSPYFGTPIEVAKFVAGGYGQKILSMTARGENYLREAMIISKELKAVRRHRYGALDYRRYIKGIDDTMQLMMQQMANGHNPFLKHEMDHVVKETARVLGDFSKADKPLLGVIAPFYRWMEFITKFVLWEAPAHYPGRTLLMTQLGNMGWNELTRMGLLPPNIQGSIPASGLSDRKPDPDQDKIDKVMTLMYTQAWNGPSTVANLFGVNAATGEIGASGLIKNLNPFYQSIISGLTRLDIANRRELKDANNQPFPGSAGVIAQLTVANMLRSFWPAVVGYDYTESADNSIPLIREIYKQPSKNAQTQSSTAQQALALVLGTRYRPYDLTILQQKNIKDSIDSLNHAYRSLADSRHPGEISPAQQKFQDQIDIMTEEQLKSLHTWIDMYGPIPDSALFGGNP
jgi:hypothetical protein